MNFRPDRKQSFSKWDEWQFSSNSKPFMLKTQSFISSVSYNKPDKSQFQGLLKQF
jgi:hypothetical protein